VAVEAKGTEAVLQCVRQGLGLCVTSRLAAQGLLDSGILEVVDVPGLNIKRAFFATRHLKRHFFPALRYFWRHVTTTVQADSGVQNALRHNTG
jgi:LysR family transcriptional regulator, transcriptional activator of the cysJI operon